MYSDYALDNYIPGNTLIYKLNPVVKVLCTMIFFLLTQINTSFYLLVFLLLIMIGIIIIEKLPFINFLKSVWQLKYLMLFLIVINILLNTTYINIVSLLVRLILLILNATILTITTKVMEINYAFNMMLKPLKLFKFSFQSVSLILTLTLNFIPIIFKQFQRILKSQISRGLDFKNKRIKTLKNLLIPIIILSFKKSNELAESIELKFYSPDRTNYHIFKWTILDTSVMIIYILGLSLVLLKEVL